MIIPSYVYTGYVALLTMSLLGCSKLATCMKKVHIYVLPILSYLHAHNIVFIEQPWINGDKSQDFY